MIANIFFIIAAVAGCFAVFAGLMAIHYSIKADAASGFEPF